MKDVNKRKLRAVLRDVGEIVWETLPMVMWFVFGLAVGSGGGC